MNQHNNLPKVSVIIPAFNAAEFLRETLEYAITQTYQNTEILVIDDGSVDETPTIAKSFGDTVRVISTENQGVAKARNTGIESATGEFLAFLDADDIWAPEKLKSQIDAVDDDHRLIYTNTTSFGNESMSGMSISANEAFPSGDIRAQLILRNFVATSSVLLDRKIALQIGGFNPAIPVCDDWDAWIRALSLTKARYIDQPLVCYRVHQASLGSNIEKRLAGSFQVIDSGLEMLGMTGSKKKAIRGQARAECYSYTAMLARSEARDMLAIKLFLHAYMNHPSRNLLKEIVKTFIGPKMTQHIKSGYSL